MKIAKLTEKAVVVRDNKLILGRFNMSAEEYRVVLWLISQVDERVDDPFEGVWLPIPEFGRFLGVTGHSIFETMAAVTGRLVRRAVEVWDEDRQEYVQVPWMAIARYRYGEGEGRVELALNPRIKPYVLELKKNFTSILLKYAVRLKSYYAQRVYEIVKSERFKGAEVEVELEELRTMLGLEKKRLRDFRNFRRKVLDVAVNEISERTDICMSWRGLNSTGGRTISHIVFAAKQRGHADGAPIDFLPETVGDDLYRALLKAGLNAKEAAKAVKEWGTTDPDRIRWHLATMKRMIEEGKTFSKSPVAWLRSGLKTDYRPQKSLFEVTTVQRKEKALRARARAEEGTSAADRDPTALAGLLGAKLSTLSRASGKKAA